jgi:hypothetical protein
VSVALQRRQREREREKERKISVYTFYRQRGCQWCCCYIVKQVVSI